MKIYAFISASTNVVGNVQGFGAHVTVTTSPDAYVIECDGTVEIGDIYDTTTKAYTKPPVEPPVKGARE